MEWYWWLLIILGGLAGLVALFALLATWFGARQPAQHVAARTLPLKQPPEAVWSIISDHANEPSWQPSLAYMKRLPDRDGREVWEMKHKGGGSPPMTLAITEKAAPTRLVRTIADAKQVFSGRWEFTLAPSNGGSRLTITEHGAIPNPFFRGMWKLFSSPTQYIDMYLRALAAKFGEPAAIEQEAGMFLAKVTGSVVATQKAASMVGHKLFLVEPLRVNPDNHRELVSTQRTFVVVDTVGAGQGEIVLIVQGSSARLTPETEKLPIDAVIIGIVDTVNVENRTIFSSREQSR